MSHILLQNLHYQGIRNMEVIDGYLYDNAYGAWLSTTQNALLIMDERFVGIASKKKDIETGENQK